MYLNALKIEITLIFQGINCALYTSKKMLQNL